MKTTLNRLILAGLVAGVWLLTSGTARAHCDTMDGPVVNDAMAALERKDVEPVLNFVHHLEALQSVAMRKPAPHGHPEPASPSTKASHHEH